MSDKIHFDLINKLSSEHKKVDIHLSAPKRATIWFCLHLSFITLISYLRLPMYFDIFLPNLITEILLFISFAFSSGYIAFLTMVPGALTKKHIYMTASLFVLLMSSLIYGLFNPIENKPDQIMRNFCEVEIIVYSLVPFIHLFYLAAKGIYFNSKKSLFIGAVACSAIPAIVMHIACAYNYKHILIFHILPLLLISLVLAALGNYFLTRSGSSK